MTTTIDYKKFTEYKNGKVTLEQLNEYLAPFGLGYDPEKNVIVDGGAVPCEDVTKINGYGLLDTGTGTLDKVMIKDGKLVDSIGNMPALVLVGDIYYKVVAGDTLVK